MLRAKSNTRPSSRAALAISTPEKRIFLLGSRNFASVSKGARFRPLSRFQARVSAFPKLWIQPGCLFGFGGLRPRLNGDLVWLREQSRRCKPLAIQLPGGIKTPSPLLTSDCEGERGVNMDHYTINEHNAIVFEDTEGLHHFKRER